MYKPIASLIILSFLISESYALQLKDLDFKLPKVQYKAMKKTGMDDSEEVALRRSLRPLLKDQNIAPSLRDKTTEPKTYSLVQEIDLENMGWNIRLLKAKTRQAILEHVRQNWDKISKTTINTSGSNKFEIFAHELKRQLKNNLLLRAYGENWLIYELSWVRVRLFKNKNIAQIITQQDYLADTNELTEVALNAHASGDSGPKAKYKDRGFGKQDQIDSSPETTEEEDDMFFRF
jgi:hypothetical protein